MSHYPKFVDLTSIQPHYYSPIHTVHIKLVIINSPKTGKTCIAFHPNVPPKKGATARAKGAHLTFPAFLHLIGHVRRLHSKNRGKCGVYSCVNTQCHSGCNSCRKFTCCVPASAANSTV